MMIIALLGLGFLASCGNGTDEQPGDPDAPVNINFEFIDPPFQGAYKIGETLRFRLTIETEREGGFDIEENRFRLEYGGSLGNPTGIGGTRVFFDYTIDPGTKFYQEEFSLLLEDPFEGTDEEVADIDLYINVLAQNNGFRFAEIIDLGPAVVEETSFKVFNNYEGKPSDDTTWVYEFVGDDYISLDRLNAFSGTLRAVIQNQTFDDPSGLSFVRGFRIVPGAIGQFLMVNDYIDYDAHRFNPALKEIWDAHQDELITEVTELVVGDTFIIYDSNRELFFIAEVNAIQDDMSDLEVNDFIEFKIKRPKYDSR